MSRQRLFHAISLCFFALFLLVLVGFFSHAAGGSNIVGPTGALVSGALFAAFGYASFVLLLIILSAAFYFLKPNRQQFLERIFTSLFLATTGSALLAKLFPASAHYAGGFVGAVLSGFFTAKTGNTGSWIVVLMINAAGLILGGLLSFDIVVHRIKEKSGKMGNFIKQIVSKRRISSDEKIPLFSRTEKRNGKIPWITKETVIVDHPCREQDEELPIAKELELLAQKMQQDERDCRDVQPYVPQVSVQTKPEKVEDNPFALIREAIPLVRTVAEPIETEAQLEPFNLPGGIRANRIKNISELNAIPLYQVESYVKPAEMEIIHPAVEEYAKPRTQKEESETFEVAIPETDEPDVMIDSHAEEELSIVEIVDERTPENSDAVIMSELPVEMEADEEEEAFAEELLADEAALTECGETEEDALFEDDDDLPAPSGEKIFEEIPLAQEYVIPLSCLTLSEAHDYDSWQEEVQRNSILLVKTLKDFGVESKVTKVNRGPVLTQYEMQIAPGIKVTKIVGLADDIAMALAASRVRVVAPIPGKSAIGIEIPNGLREMVTLGDVFSSGDYQHCDMSLKVGLGKDILGKPVMLDLKKQPHILIAGATGAGKSVCVNTIVSSLVYNYDPNYVRFIMVDPKMVELQLYNGMPHQLTPVITEPDVAPKALKWAIYEMERRYKLLSECAVRDIERYNQKVAAYGRSTAHEKLPYIVIIVDELADLMMVAPKEIENHITRIAQKARAVGIHLVLATQRPSVDIITGVIKANFPARIAFQVAQKIDSRTIIDQNGAEKLLGKGDLLYQSPMSSFPVRIQGAFISEDEIVKIVKQAKKFGSPKFIDIEESLAENDEFDDDDIEESDEMFTEALKIIEQTKKASASYLQRRLSIGYNRAARIIERMEELGYVGPQQGSKQREVYL